MKRIFFCTFCLSLLLFSCKKHQSVGNFKVDNFSTGKAGEMILVIDDQFFSEELQQIIIDSLEQAQPAINQIEPMFDVIHLQNNEFTSNFLRHRNIVHFDLQPRHSANTITFDRNSWSNPQVYIKIKGNNADSCLAIFNRNADTILQLMYENDLKRVQYAFNRELNHEVVKKIKNKFGISLIIPSHYFVANELEDFIWLRFRTTKNDRFIMVYKTPAYELTEQNVMDVRDTITKRYIPGAVKNAYPIIARKFGFPIISSKKIGNKNGIEMRGIWESVGDHMGGPFYSFTFLSADKQYCITVDGFVYAPQENKRDFLREVEAIVKSVK